MKRLLIFALLIPAMQALGEEDFKLKLEGQAKPTLPMPPRPVADVSVRGKEKRTDLQRSYFGLVSFTSRLEKDLRSLEATTLTVSDAASLSALRAAAYSTGPVGRYLTWLRTNTHTAVDQVAVQKAIETAEDALARYEQLREEMVERKK